jgi:hypothetical protein
MSKFIIIINIINDINVIIIIIIIHDLNCLNNNNNNNNSVTNHRFHHIINISRFICTYNWNISCVFIALLSHQLVAGGLLLSANGGRHSGT